MSQAARPTGPSIPADRESGRGDAAARAPRGIAPGTPGQPPLEGIRVVDLTSYIAGSYAAMMLADLGAAVIKVESLGGDSFRELPAFFGWNRGKRSITVNLKAPEGRIIVEQLVARGDVFLENMRVGVADRLGLGEARLRALNPRLVYGSITAFGSTGPYVDRPAFDPVLQALAGVMVHQGFGGPPEYLRIPVTDYYAAALCAQAVLAALFVRERTGCGQRVETSLLHAALALQSGHVVDYPGKPSAARDNPTYRLYQAEDGAWLFLACGNQSFWAKLCQALGMPHLADDPRFASWMLRLDNRHALLPLMEATFRTRPRARWLEILAAHDIPAAPVQPLAEFMDDPAVRHHGMVREYRHPEVGRLRLMGQPLLFSNTPVRDPGPPPTLGQHTDAVLGELGYDASAIAALRARGAVGGHARSPQC
jgi:crotonobetainyl-CoA:carnitine CoA-transferase CaiB-like acyl-CoA transferase